MIPEFPAEEVRDLRKALGMTGEQFAQEIGVTKGLISQWENGTGKPKGPAAILLYQLQARASAARSAKSA